MELKDILSAIAVLISLVALLLSARKEARQDAAGTAAGTARLEAKLDSISSGVEDIRVETRTMRSRVDGLAERLSAVESSCRSAHHRLDQLQAHPPD
jgi:outer membrane murein-binding lipoprotein Lpp